MVFACTMGSRAHFLVPLGGDKRIIQTPAKGGEVTIDRTWRRNYGS
jgi:hypothetical protein